MIIKKYTLFILLISTFLFSACHDDDPHPGEGDPGCGPAISEEATEYVLNHHLAGFGARDMDEIMFDYTDESVLVTPDGIFTGLAEIEAFYTALLPALPADDTTLEIDVLSIKDDIAYIVWHAETSALNIPLGTDTFIIHDGKIAKQTFVAQILPK